MIVVSLLGIVVSEAPTYGGTLIYCIESDPPHLNPSITTHTTVRVCVGAIYEGLFIYKQTYKEEDMIPALAESMTVSSDSKTYTFKLVRNATWHDGVPFTSADVKFTYEQLLVKYHPRQSRFASILDAVETPDNYTVVFKWKVSNFAFRYTLSIDNFPVLPLHLWNGTDPLQNPYASKPVGTGPMKFKEWNKGQYVEVERNGDYHYSVYPYLDRIIYKILPDPETRTEAILKGEVDYVWWWAIPYYNLPLFEEEEAKGTGLGISRVDAEPPVVAIHFFNLQRPIFQDIRVRQAIAYAINETYIVDKALHGWGYPGTSCIGIGSPYHNPNVTRYDYNVTKANELLDAAGYTRGAGGVRFTISVMEEVGKAHYVKAAQIMAEQLAQVGIKVQVIALDSTTEAEYIYMRRDFDIGGVCLTYAPDPEIAVARCWVSSMIYPYKYYTNAATYNNSRVDELFDLAARATTFEERKAYYDEVQEIIAEELPAIILFEEKLPTLYRKDKFHYETQYHVDYVYPWRNVWMLASAQQTPSNQNWLTQYQWVIVGAVVIIVVVGMYAWIAKKKIRKK